jgi:predicted DNA binding CopG/RHH family protein
MNHKYFELTDQEQEILSSFEAGEWKSVSDLSKAKKLYTSYANNTLDKTKNVNLRLSEKTVLKLKAKAIAEGIPYQTLESSVLHKYANQS